MLKNLLKFKLSMIIVGIVMSVVIIIGIISTATGTVIGYENLKNNLKKKEVLLQLQIITFIQKGIELF